MYIYNWEVRIMQLTWKIMKIIFICLFKIEFKSKRGFSYSYL